MTAYICGTILQARLGVFTKEKDMRPSTAILCAACFGFSLATAADQRNQANGGSSDNSTQRIVNPERTPTTSTDGTASNGMESGKPAPTDSAPTRTNGHELAPGKSR